MKNKFLIIAIIVIGMFAAAFFILKNNFQNSPIENQTETAQSAVQAAPFSVVPVDNNILIKPHSPSKGAEDAKVIVVEYLDPECESCSAMYPAVKKIFEEYKSQIKLVVRYMTYHQNSQYVANILEGARAENKYWEALELIFESQDQWANHHNPNPDLLPEILKPLNLNIKKIIADAKAGKYDKQIMEDVADGDKVGVKGTPTFFVNGTQVEDLSYEAIKKEIETAIKRTSN